MVVVEQLTSLLRDGGGRAFAPHASPVIVDLRPICVSEITSSTPTACRSPTKARMYELPPPRWGHRIARRGPRNLCRAGAAHAAHWTCAELDAADAATWEASDGGDATTPSLSGRTRSSAPCSRGAAAAAGRGHRRRLRRRPRRDFLAQRLPAGWSVHGVDSHVGALDRARARGGRGLSVGFEGRDVRKERCPPRCGAATAPPRPRLPLPPPAAARRAPRRARARRPAQSRPPFSTRAAPAARRSARRPPAPARRAARGARGARLETLCDEEGELHTKGEFVPAQFFAARRLE